MKLTALVLMSGLVAFAADRPLPAKALMQAALDLREARAG